MLEVWILDDIALVAGLKAGNNEAQLKFWQQYWDEVYPICFRILKKSADATDVAVDLLTDFMNHYVTQLEDPKALHAYLRMMAIRRATTHRDRAAKMVTLAFDPQDVEGVDPEEITHWQELVPRLDVCLEKLTPKARQVVRLRFRHERNNVQIGQSLGGSKQYIGRLIKQSLGALKRCLDARPVRSEVKR